MWSTSAGGHLMKVVNLTGFTDNDDDDNNNNGTFCRYRFTVLAK
jgi:hypothetical protein